MNYSFPKIVEMLAAGRACVLATIVETEGSAPQVPGASAIFSSAGLAAGTVGGGLLEARVEAAAGEAMRDGRARLMTVRLDADPSDMEGAICGGAARILVDPGVQTARAVFEKALEGFKRRRPGCLAVEIREGEGDPISVKRRFLEAGGGPDAAKALSGLGPAAFEAALRDGRPRLVRSDSSLIFLEPVLPLPRLIVAGAGHVGRAVARLGSLLDWSVTVIDDRAEFANAANVPEADEIVVGTIGESLMRVEDSPDNSFVIVTRGHQKDAEALRAVVKRPAAYIGMIGSRTKVDLMHREFLESGWATAEEWARVHAPIGLDIGSKTVEEIAVSIAAELVLVRSARKKKDRP
jgi:xanthine dehydrogenase accessory factor